MSVFGAPLFTGCHRHEKKLGFTRFWCERGLIHYEDMRDGRYGSMSVRTAWNRVKAINHGLKRAMQSDHWRSSKVGVQVMMSSQDFVAAMADLIKYAVEQGSPFKKEVVDDRKRRASVTVSVPHDIVAGLPPL